MTTQQAPAISSIILTIGHWANGMRLAEYQLYINPASGQVTTSDAKPLINGRFFEDCRDDLNIDIVYTEGEGKSFKSVYVPDWLPGDYGDTLEFTVVNGRIDGWTLDETLFNEWIQDQEEA